ncbi:uncharacterized protein LOC126902536 [Daktulosphaira vitifoliae]|uniref:uncharacterized protein LOC126902536 n=1 Tax=Daktulosphaira vitifoliae TaxID=58002 RepID=UPI0021AAAC28|nr:uncharacterized protein LOC126902536 [Daktulosphaira vitifoliae]
MNIKNYQTKLLNIFKTILLHLMKKQAMYGDLLLKANNLITIVKCHNEMGELLSKLYVHELFGDIKEDFSTIVNSFKGLPSNCNIIRDAHLVMILNIQGIIDNIKPNHFKLFDKNISDPEYLSNQMNLVQNLISDIGISKKNFDDKITPFKKIIDDGLSYNYSIIYMYIYYLNNTFKGWKSGHVTNVNGYALHKCRGPNELFIMSTLTAFEDTVSSWNKGGRRKDMLKKFI